MLEIENLNEKCTGCEACVSSCYHSAITMGMNQHGFYYPCVKKDTCTGCKVCEKVCPVINHEDMNNETEQDVYAAWITDREIRFQSSSGGVFTALANTVLQKGGVVYGATFDPEMQLKHVAIYSEAELKNIRGSKYIQSHTAEAYKEIKQISDQKTVLFCGTPCQIDGLKRYLGSRKKNLYTLDLICHGIISNGFFEEYIKDREKHLNNKITSVRFRDKVLHWKKPTFSIVFNNGEEKREMANSNYVLGLVYSNMIARSSCYSCKYANKKRLGDITLGDYWGIEHFHPDIDTHLGVSLVIVNTEKGKLLFNMAKNQLEIHPSTIDHGAAGNRTLQRPCRKNKFRGLSLYLIRNLKFSHSKKIVETLVFLTKCTRKVIKD